MGAGGSIRVALKAAGTRRGGLTPHAVCRDPISKGPQTSRRSKKTNSSLLVQQNNSLSLPFPLRLTYGFLSHGYDPHGIRQAHQVKPHERDPVTLIRDGPKPREPVLDVLERQLREGRETVKFRRLMEQRGEAAAARRRIERDEQDTDGRKR